MMTNYELLKLWKSICKGNKSCFSCELKGYCFDSTPEKWNCQKLLKKINEIGKKQAKENEQ